MPHEMSGKKQTWSFKIDETNLKAVEQYHVESNKLTKCKAKLHSFHDHFEARIRTKTYPNALQHTETRCLRKRRRSCSDENESACELLPEKECHSDISDDKELSFRSFKSVVELVHKVLGTNIPGFYLNIGSGTTAQCVIIASASGRFLTCDGIEISSTRFQKSQQSLSTAKTLGFLKSECRIIEGDVLTSTNIRLQHYNVYSFFEKVRFDVSQKVIQKVIIQHSSNAFALGPILCFTFMTSSQLKDALCEVQDQLDSAAWNRLIINESECIIESTGVFACQHFKCTMVHIREREQELINGQEKMVTTMEQEKTIHARAISNAQELVSHRVKQDKLIQNEILWATAKSKAQTEVKELSKVCRELSACQSVNRSLVLNKEARAFDCKTMSRQPPCMGITEFSTLIFTSLSDAITEWENARDAKSRNDLPEFNVLATVCKWSEPKKTKGVNFVTILKQRTNKWFKGTDMHVAATLYSNERDRTINASFFFDTENFLKPCLAGEQVRLIGTRLQLWNGCLQLTGKNIRFGRSVVSMSLPNAIEAWKYVTRVQPLLFLRKNIKGAQRHFPDLTMILMVKNWCNAAITKGAKISIIPLTLRCMRFTFCQGVTFTFQLSFRVHQMQIAP
jgi:hypothetical protein